MHRSNLPGGHAEIFVLAKGVFALGRAQNEESFAISNISETITSSVLKRMYSLSKKEMHMFENWLLMKNQQFFSNPHETW